jgi:Flp pilus assembly protein TadG
MMSKNIDGLPVDHGRRRAGNRAEARMTSGVTDRLRRLLGCSRGVAAVEFALAAPILLGALVPVADLGIAFAKQQQLRQAVQAGAQYAALRLWDTSTSPALIASVVTAATPLSGVTVYPSPYQQCGCSNGSAITTATCASTCENGQITGSYVVVSAQLVYTPVLPYSLLGGSKVLTAQSMVRIP